MAKLTRAEVLKLANLAKLPLAEDEIEQFTKEINEILGYVEQLQKVDVAGLEPTYQVTGLERVTRPDEVVNYGPSPKELLANVPTTENSYIKVKRVL